MSESFTQVLSVRAAVAGTVDPGGVCADPEVLRLRLGVLWACQQDAIDNCHFSTREQAKQACKRGDKVVELHGLSGFFVRVRATGQLLRHA